MTVTEREDELIAFGIWVATYMLRGYRGELFESEMFSQEDMEWLYYQIVPDNITLVHGNPYSPKDWGLSMLIGTDEKRTQKKVR